MVEMDLFLDTTSGSLSTESGGSTDLAAISAKRGSDLDIYVIPDHDIAITSTGLFVAAFPGQTQPVFSVSWLPPADRSKGWLVSVPLRGAGFDDIFLGGGTSTTLEAELTVVIGAKVRKSQTINFTVVAEVHDHTAP